MLLKEKHHSQQEGSRSSSGINPEITKSEVWKWQSLANNWRNAHRTVNTADSGESYGKHTLTLTTQLIGQKDTAKIMSTRK